MRHDSMDVGRWGILVWGLILLVAFASLGSVAEAHFRVAVNIRVVHVEHAEGGVRVYMRVPMPLVVAELLGPETGEGP